MQALLAASGAEVIPLWFCKLGGDSQQVRALVAWPKAVAERFRRISVPCDHKSHTKLLIGADAHAGRAYPEVVAETIALAHLQDPHMEGIHLGMLASMSASGSTREIRFL